MHWLLHRGLINKYSPTQGTGSILHYIFLLPPRVFSEYKSIQLGSNVVMGISDSMSMCVWVFVY